MTKPILPYDGRFRISKLYGTPPPAGVHYSTGKHPGVDFVGISGKVIRAVMDGKVIRAGYDANGWGKYVAVQQSDGLFTIYCHLSSHAVIPGQQVQSGQKIGVEGATGQVTGKHLHFEVRRVYSDKFSTINPTQYLDIKNAIGEVEENMAKIIPVRVQLPSGAIKTVDGILQAGTNYVALRQVLEALGFKVGWVNNTITINR